ncbi:hypothetical protein K8B83_18915 [Shewanella inventionis]|uniref:hypothetical protein n=1 Tax=Shewanella inventionis TaxID=1738770 RepID=UPI001CC018D0|nr:hypothetical protein [Shewanella inventionis]UAL42864.1 hypothetical protein K8B83_18915 [Shewanella inventionis]
MMEALMLYKKYFCTDLKRKVLDALYKEMQKYENKYDIDIELLVSQIIQKLTDPNTKSNACYFTSNSDKATTPFITSCMVKQSTNNITQSITADMNYEIKKDIYSDSQAGQNLNKIVSEKVDIYNKRLLNNDMPNTLDTLMCLIEVEDICIKTSRSSIKDIINTRYSELDETDQFTVTLATGYNSI